MGETIQLLIDTGATHSVLISFSGRLSSRSVAIVGVDGISRRNFFTPALTCQFEGQIFSHEFLIVPRCPAPLLGRDLLAKLGVILKFQPRPKRILLVETTTDQLDQISQQVDPAAWYNGIPGKANSAIPIIIKLKDPNRFPNQRQYPIREEARKGLQPLIDKFLKYGLLIPCQSPCNSPVLPIVKPSGEYRMVQDLRLINEAVIPIHPLVADPYTILSQIPGDTKWFSVLDLKDTFFIIPLHLTYSPHLG